MTYRPIIMSGDSVLAILERRKTQTRRVVMPQPQPELDWIGWITDTTWRAKDIGKACWGKDDQGVLLGKHLVRCPYGVTGDRLWVRETWAHIGKEPDTDTVYKADGCWSDKQSWKWCSPLFMPREYSRLTLEILSIRVERVQEITHSDAVAEGIPVITDPECPEPDERYAVLWDFLNAKRGYSWKSNPWVWVIEFKKVEDNL